MSYFAEKKNAVFPYGLSDSPVCLECNRPVDRAGVSYDGFVDRDTGRTFLFHADCAAIVGQRLITDGYPHRRTR